MAQPTITIGETVSSGSDLFVEYSDDFSVGYVTPFIPFNGTDWAVSGGVLHCVGGGGSSVIAPMRNFTDFTLQADVNNEGSSYSQVGLTFRVQDIDNYSFCDIDANGPSGKDFRVGQRVDGTWTIVYFTCAVSDSVTYDMKVVAVGSTISFYLDDVLLGTVEDTELLYGGLGLKSLRGTPTGWIDNLNYSGTYTVPTDNAVIAFDDGTNVVNTGGSGYNRLTGSVGYECTQSGWVNQIYLETSGMEATQDFTNTDMGVYHNSANEMATYRLMATSTAKGVSDGNGNHVYQVVNTTGGNYAFKNPTRLYAFVVSNFDSSWAAYGIYESGRTISNTSADEVLPTGTWNPTYLRVSNYYFNAWVE